MSLISEYDVVFRAGSKWVPPPAPTAESLEEIALRLGLPGFPVLLTQLAAESKYYGVWFAGLGPDYDSRTNILNLNNYWHENGLPRRFVLITYGFDGVCDCLDLKSSNDPDRLCVAQLQMEDGIYEGYEEFAPSFEEYLVKLLDLNREGKER